MGDRKKKENEIEEGELLSGHRKRRRGWCATLLQSENE